MRKFKKHDSDNAEFIVTPKPKRTLGEAHIGAVLRGLFFFLLVTVPIGIFAYVIYHSSGFKIYAQSDIWNHMDVPNAHNIYILFWVGMGLLIATTLLIACFPFITKFLSNKKIQTGYIFGIIFLAVIGVLLASLSQYFYAKFYDFYLYEAKVEDGTHVQDWAKDITEKLSNDWKNNNGTSHGIFDWMQSSVVWWVMFVQFMFLFSVGVTLQNALNKEKDLNDYEKYIADTKQDEAGIDLNKVSKFFKNTFSLNDKSIAMFLIISAVIVVIPNFIYSIIGTVDSTHMQAIVAWSFKVPTLIKDINLTNHSEAADINRIVGEFSKAKYGSEFLVSSLPIIFEGLTIATVFFFIAILLRGKNVSNRIFIVEAAVLGAEMIALVAVAFASKVYVHRLANFLSTSVDGKTNIQSFTDDLSNILGSKYNELKGSGMYPLNGINEVSNIHIEWLGMAPTIAEVVIAYAWVFGTFTLIGNGIYKLGYFKKANGTTYSTGILNS